MIDKLIEAHALCMIRDVTHRFIVSAREKYIAIILILAVTVIAACDRIVTTGEISEEYLRISKVKSLNFKALSEIEKQKIASLPALSPYVYRISDWASKWAVARDGNYFVYRGGAATSKSKYATFIIVWSIAKNRAVFSEVGRQRVGHYPPNLDSSP